MYGLENFVFLFLICGIMGYLINLKYKESDEFERAQSKEARVQNKEIPAINKDIENKQAKESKRRNSKIRNKTPHDDQVAVVGGSDKSLLRIRKKLTTVSETQLKTNIKKINIENIIKDTSAFSYESNPQ